MMASGALLGHGTLFQNSDGSSPPMWSTVAEVANIALPSITRDSIDTSGEEAPGEWKTAIPGMPNGGQMSFDFNFIPGGPTFDDLLAELGDEDVRERRVLFPNGTWLPFSGFLTALNTNADMADKLSGTATFQVSGQVGPIEE